MAEFYSVEFPEGDELKQAAAAGGRIVLLLVIVASATSGSALGALYSIFAEARKST